MPKTMANAIPAPADTVSLGSRQISGRLGRNAVLPGALQVEGRCSLLTLGDTTRLALLVTSRGKGTFLQQGLEVLHVIEGILAESPVQAAITVQTVFLRDAATKTMCERLFQEHFGTQLPVTNYIIQPPCGGGALAIEAWAIGGDSVRLHRLGSQSLAVEYDGMRWIYCGNVSSGQHRALTSRSHRGAYNQAIDCLNQLGGLLNRAHTRFSSVIRTWLYVGGITQRESNSSRYHELNRARTDFYRSIDFGESFRHPGNAPPFFPASTGIGISDTGMVMSCIALETERRDVAVLPIENPHQTSAFSYDATYSPQSPKFSRAVALQAGNQVTTWISGTASIVNSETRHPGNIEAQTEQTIDNIQCLITPENFARHQVRDAGASLQDLAKIRVYLKNPADLSRCRAICERRFGNIPALYILADICRPDLLVEIEGVAFSSCPRSETDSACPQNPPA